MKVEELLVPSPTATSLGAETDVVVVTEEIVVVVAPSAVVVVVPSAVVVVAPSAVVLVPSELVVSEVELVEVVVVVRDNSAHDDPLMLTHPNKPTNTSEANIIIFFMLFPFC